MSSINVVVSSPAVQAVVTSNGVSASVSGGFGPTGSQGIQGPAGPQGPSGVTTLAGADDVSFSGLAAGDVLRYDTTGRWVNYPDKDLLDAGSF